MRKFSRIVDELGLDDQWKVEACNDLRVAQEISLVRHLPVVVLGNALGMVLCARVVSEWRSWLALAPMLLGMAGLMIPIGWSWLRLRGLSRPTQISVARLRSRVGYCGLLGLFWAVCLAHCLPGAGAGAIGLLALGACFLVLGAAATMFVLPMAALAYAAPILAAAVYLGLAAREHYGSLLCVLVLLAGVVSICILRDNWINFSEVLWLIREKSQLLHEAATMRRAEEEFVENLNHEMRNALTSTIGYFDVAANPALTPDEHRELIEHARETGGLLQVLLSDLLDVGRLNAGRTRLSLTPFSFRHLVRTSIVSASAAINGRDLVVTSHVDDSVPQLLIGDAARLQQILLNLIGNALKVMTSGTVVVRASYRGNLNPLLEVTVSDNGPGISRERQKTLFNRFSRFAEVPPSTGPVVGGWGLGLSICAALVELMRGDIRAC